MQVIHMPMTGNEDGQICQHVTGGTVGQPDIIY